jgi:hypothetical protein
VLGVLYAVWFSLSKRFALQQPIKDVYNAMAPAPEIDQPFIHLKLPEV